MEKTINDMARYIKNLIPENIPETYTLKPMFKSISDEESIRNGVLAFREFLYLLCDCLIANGSIYDDSPKNTKKDVSHSTLSISYPFLNDVKSVLVSIGWNGKLVKSGTTLLIDNWELLTPSLGAGGHWQAKSPITVPRLIKCLRFLSNCGIQFDGIDLEAETKDMSNVTSLEIKYTENMLLGLKVMAVATKELHTSNSNDDIFLRCDYRELKDEEIDIKSILKDIIHPLPAKVQEFVLNLHQHYIDAGLTCKAAWKHLGFGITYLYKSKEMWSFSVSPSSGYRILIKAKNTEKYMDVIQKFPMSLQETISKGYGCQKKRFGEPCQHGCHGFSFTLDDCVLDIDKDIETWIDTELSCLQRKR